VKGAVTLYYHPDHQQTLKHCWSVVLCELWAGEQSCYQPGFGKLLWNRFICSQISTGMTGCNPVGDLASVTKGSRNWSESQEHTASTCEETCEYELLWSSVGCGFLCTSVMHIQLFGEEPFGLPQISCSLGVSFSAWCSCRNSVCFLRVRQLLMETICQFLCRSTSHPVKSLLAQGTFVTEVECVRAHKKARGVKIYSS